MMQTVDHTIQGDISINSGPVAYNTKNQDFIQWPQPTSYLVPWINSHNPMKTQVNGSNTLGNADLADTFQDLPEIGTNGHFIGRSQQCQALPQMALVTDFSNSGYGSGEAASIANGPLRMGPSYSISHNYHTAHTDNTHGDYTEHKRFLQNWQHNISSHPVKAAAGFSVQNAPKDHREYHVPGSELDPIFKERIGLSRMHNYFGTHNGKDMPYHVWQQGKDIIFSTYQSLKTQGWVHPQTVSMTRLFDPEELRWLGEQAEEGKKRSSLELEPVPLDVLTCRFRQRYC
ncbi:hypothetical protein BKA64DRAFT_715945 [Cadophora sp. MPI-SDFR-AT-0126]|nr:hypothetical protein BKA64DRAFT_715945 [Leotiomycetes sp. MPI-SDFR-AT-0126]